MARLHVFEICPNAVFLIIPINFTFVVLSVFCSPRVLVTFSGEYVMFFDSIPDLTVFLKCLLGPTFPFNPFPASVVFVSSYRSISVFLHPHTFVFFSRHCPSNPNDLCNPDIFFEAGHFLHSSGVSVLPLSEVVYRLLFKYYCLVCSTNVFSFDRAGFFLTARQPISQMGFKTFLEV